MHPSPSAAPKTDPSRRGLASSSRSAARWIDRAIVALLVLSLGVVMGAAAPALLRAAGLDLAVSRSAPVVASPLAMPRRPPQILEHADDLDGPFPSSGDSDETPLPEPSGQLGLTRGALVLHERPASSAGVVGDVQAGEMVTVLRIAGDWALVYYGGEDGLVIGWAKKSEIAIR